MRVRTLADISEEAVGRLLKRANKRNCSGKKKHVNISSRHDSIDTPAIGPNRNDKLDVDPRDGVEGCNRDALQKTAGEERLDGGSMQNASPENENELNDLDWEDGSIPILDSTTNLPVTIEISETPNSNRRKPSRRASAEDKELAELVHKVHLLCLLARGRLIDSACDDPLIQASLLSLLPKHLLNVSKVTQLTATALYPLVHWFQNNFHVRSSTSAERSFRLGLASALETREGTPEEIVALSVALFRALNLTTRFLSILDVASLKPDAGESEIFSQDASRLSNGIFKSSTLMVARPNKASVSPVKSFSSNAIDNICETSQRGSCKSRDSYSACDITQSEGSSVAGDLDNKMSDSLACEAGHDTSEECLTKVQGTKRKGDLEFERQLEIALSATAGVTLENKIQSNARDLDVVDGEQKVEAMAAACKTSLRYVVAFAGRGAKDVTRRYCMKWYRIASRRVNSIWWDAVLAPLKELEAGATGGMVHMDKQQIESSTEHKKEKTSRELGNPNQDVVTGDAILHGMSTLEVVKEYGKKIDIESSVNDSFVATRSSLEDMELETRALTEPLPTNQQAYRNHQLYAIERWLTKYQVLYPKAPVLGFCSGHPVYPRSCVQTLKTKERWLREGLQVKAHELPVKELKRSVRLPRVSDPEDDECGGGNYEGTIQLYGKWQLEALHLPRAVNGIVPKNERGQVEVWSEKCLPPGTVHLRLPRVFYVAKRLEIDYAPAMVGFEFRNGRSHPIFDGIVVCAEFKDAILEAYVEEEERREVEEKKRNEMQAISRWYQLLCSIITRQRLNNRYGESSLAQTSTDIQRNSRLCAHAGVCDGDGQSRVCQQEGTHSAKLDSSSAALSEDHEHVFLTENQSFDDESLVLIKRCHCGFSVQVEEL
ncbi:hypothetical protein CIPAW_03G071800 [Carya illinoinensis]|uniref:DNA repair protein RAD4 n=1 Tax=Carya illinoinensis TaxID=32201 RepID=A0A8T1R1J1_CARIL|nr:hypothetical protein CIPAW_03G071800 [Carya illinoinensis]